MRITRLARHRKINLKNRHSRLRWNDCIDSALNIENTVILVSN